MTNITNCLWLDGTAEEAANYYTSLLRDGRILSVTHYTPEMAEASGSKVGDVVTVEFEAEGQKWMTLNGGTHFSITPGISFMIERDTQDGIDELWDSFCDGGQTMACGWVTDRFGVSWQVIPSQMMEWMSSDDLDAKRRMWTAMLAMVKLDLATLQAAFEGTATSNR
jgi:predicted 3-demethylubiquinone-9 3-methyltransferase (glyoxalase superfamily)